MLAKVALFLFFAAVAAALSPMEAYGLTDTDLIRTVSITEDGGIKKHVIKEGTGAIAKAGQKINAHYLGKLAADGKEFDGSRKRGNPFGFSLGGGQVIQGWDKGFQGMAVGEKAILEITSEYGYGARGMGPIPAAATLLFEVELMSIEGGDL